MAQTVTSQHPYQAVISAILALRSRTKGWDSYDADAVPQAALLGAIDLVNRFENLGTLVPVPFVGASADGAVILRWITPDREVDLLLRDSARGEYSVMKRQSEEVVSEGTLQHLDPLKDIVGQHVVGLKTGRPSSVRR